MVVFGPIPSRRLGGSLDIKNAPPELCSYSCVYCQVGPTDSTTLARKNFYPPDEICREADAKIPELERAGKKPTT